MNKDNRARRRAAKPAVSRRAKPAGRDALVEFCRGLPRATEDIKWGDDLIFSIGGKTFAGFDADGGKPFAFKCSDDDFDRLAAIPGIRPAPYAARFSWGAGRAPRRAAAVGVSRPAPRRVRPGALVPARAGPRGARRVGVRKGPSPRSRAARGPTPLLRFPVGDAAPARR